MMKEDYGLKPCLLVGQVFYCPKFLLPLIREEACAPVHHADSYDLQASSAFLRPMLQLMMQPRRGGRDGHRLP